MLIVPSVAVHSHQSQAVSHKKPYPHPFPLGNYNCLSNKSNKEIEDQIRMFLQKTTGPQSRKQAYSRASSASCWSNSIFNLKVRLVFLPFLMPPVMKVNPRNMLVLHQHTPTLKGISSHHISLFSHFS